MMAFPVRPRAAGEQLALGLEGTLTGRYQAWRKTAEGMRIFLEIERRVLARANSGTPANPVRRIEVNNVVGDVRRDWKVQVNNSYRSYLARELRNRHAHLKDLIQIRQQRAV